MKYVPLILAIMGLASLYLSIHWCVRGHNKLQERALYASMFFFIAGTMVSAWVVDWPYYKIASLALSAVVASLCLATMIYDYRATRAVGSKHDRLEQLREVTFYISLASSAAFSIVPGVIISLL